MNLWRKRSLFFWYDVCFFLLVASVYGFYVWHTPYNVRAYDADGHVEYITYVMEHFGVPYAGDGWQFYHPPLYYILLASIGSILVFLGVSHSFSLVIFQLFSTLILTIIMGVIPCCMRRFRLFSSSFFSYLFAGFIAFFPSLIFFSSRITNDVLVFVLQIITLLLLLFFIQHRTLIWYVLAACVASFAFLSKYSGFLLLPSLIISPFFISSFSWKKSIRLASLALLIFFALTQSIVLFRMITSTNFDVIENAKNLNSSLKIHDFSLSALWMYAHDFFISPYNDAWSDSFGRQSLFTYWIKSAISGEFQFGESLKFHAYALLLQLFFFFPWIFLGFFETPHTIRQKHITLWMITVCIIVAVILIRWRYPYSSSEDFRHSMIFIFPLSYFILRAIDSAHSITQKIGITQILLFIITSIAYIIRISYLPT